MRKVILVLVLLLIVNLGFNLHVALAVGPINEWFMWKMMEDMPGGGAGMPGFFGSPRSGPGYNAWGYNYFNPYAGPIMPPAGSYIPGTLGFYNPHAGPGGIGDGWDGALHPFPFVPGAFSLYGGVYGLGLPGGWKLYGGWN